jgi:hypothetical protein
VRPGPRPDQRDNGLTLIRRTCPADQLRDLGIIAASVITLPRLSCPMICCVAATSPVTPTLARARNLLQLPSDRVRTVASRD